MKRPQLRWPRRFRDAESSSASPLEASLAAAWRECSETDGPPEETVRRAMRQALLGSGREAPPRPAAGLLAGILSALPDRAAVLRSRWVLAALGLLLLCQLGLALAAGLRPRQLADTVDWVSRHLGRGAPSASPPAPIVRPAGAVLRAAAPAAQASPAPATPPEGQAGAEEPTAPSRPRLRRALPRTDRAPVPTLAEDPLAREAALVSRAVALVDRTPSAALDLLAEYNRAFPSGALRGEASLAELRARQALGHDDRTLAWLDGLAADQFRGMTGAERTVEELRMARLELMVGAGRCAQALPELEAPLSQPAGAPLRGRALLVQATCRARTGDSQGSRSDLERYLSEFPGGPRAVQVRRALGSSE